MKFALALGCSILFCTLSIAAQNTPSADILTILGAASLVAAFLLSGGEISPRLNEDENQ